MRAGLVAGVSTLLGLVFAQGVTGTQDQVPDSLVFARAGDIFRMTIDGSESVRLTATSAKESSPAVSPDRLRIAFGRGDELWTMNTQGSEQRRLVSARPSSVRYASTGAPSWSPDGRWLFFDRVSQTPNEICGSIFRVASAGGALKRVTRGLVRGSLDTNPSVSPDGRRIAVSLGDCQPGFGPGIAVIDTAGRSTRDLRKLPVTKGVQLDPSWAPDGKRIAFVVYDADGSARSALYIANRDGSGLRRVTRWVFDTGDPAWSPDGQSIAFHRHDGLYVTQHDGSGLHRVLGSKAGDVSPVWLPRT